MNKPLFPIILMILGIIGILSRERILDYSEKINIKNRRPINRNIVHIRLIVAMTFLIILGILSLMNLY